MRSVTLNFADWLEAIFWRSFWHIYWHIFLTFLLTYLLTFFLTYLLTYLPIFFLTSFWHIFWHSFWHSFWHIFWHAFWHIFWHSFWHIKTKTSHPQLHKKSSSANSIFTSRHAAKVISMTTLCLSNVIALSASDRPAKRQLSPKMQNACSSTHTHHMHQTIPPKSSWVQEMQSWQRCRNYISWRVQTMKPDPCHCGSFPSSV